MQVFATRRRRSHTGLVVALLSALVCVGCTKSAVPPPAAPPFALPKVGDSTDTNLRMGDALPELQTADLDGNPVTIDGKLHEGGYTLIVFWSTWCGFCMLELPHEVELANRYEQDGLHVIGINADETPAIAKAAAGDHNVPWLNVFEGPDRAISTRLGINQWPALLLLDPDGHVISATPHLRGSTVTVLPDGSAHVEQGLDRTLKYLFRNGEPGEA